MCSLADVRGLGIDGKGDKEGDEEDEENEYGDF